MRPQQPGEQTGMGRGAGGRLLVAGLAVAVAVGLGVGFAAGSATNGGVKGGSSSTLAPTITVSSARVASVPAPYAIAALPALHLPPATPKRHPALSREASAPTSTPAATTPAASEPPPSSPPASSSTPVSPPPKQSSPASKPEEKIESGSGGAGQ